MKNFRQNFLTAVTILSLGFLFSCGEDDTLVADAPGVTVSAAILDGAAVASGGEVVAGLDVQFTISVTAPGGFNNLDVTGSTTRNINRNDLELDLGATSASTTITVETNETDAGGTASFTFVAVDELNQSSEEVVFTFSIVAPPSPEARAYSAILLSAPTGDFTNENFFSVSSGELYSKSEVNATTDPLSATIDFGYYYGGDDNATIASPMGFVSTTFSAQVEGWGTMNATVLKTTTMTAGQFIETVSYADIDDAFDAGTLDDNGIIPNLAAGMVLAFETVGGVKGLIHVTEIEAGFESNDFIRLDILAQLEAN